jgi:ParB-like chromosome segregation protein Spo0J
MLAKGHHRARTLGALGVTYLPCLISVCSSIDDVIAAAPWLNAAAAQRCFDEERPPMLRDFGRSALLHAYESRPRRRLLQLRVEVSSQWLP